MRKSRVNLPNRCYHLISRVAHRAFFLDDGERRDHPNSPRQKYALTKAGSERIRRVAPLALMFLAWVSMANQEIDVALRTTVNGGCLSDRRTATQLRNWGVPDRLFSEPAFTNLVSVMNRELSNCDYEYVNGLTGIVKRAAFVAALTQCGATAYHDSVVRWLGQDLVPQDARVKVWEDVTLPIATDMEDYMAMHYDAPGISNVLLNVKSLHHAASNTVSEAAIDSILSGTVKANKLYYLQNGLVDRIRDGSSN